MRRVLCDVTADASGRGRRPEACEAGRDDRLGICAAESARVGRRPLRDGRAEADCAVQQCVAHLRFTSCPTHLESTARTCRLVPPAERDSCRGGRAVACCYAAIGDKPRAIELLRDYASKVGEPLNQVNEMLLDEDLVSVREELRELRAEYKTDSGGGLFGLLPQNPLRSMADSVGVEWKD